MCLTSGLSVGSPRSSAGQAGHRRGEDSKDRQGDIYTRHAFPRLFSLPYAGIRTLLTPRLCESGLGAALGATPGSHTPIPHPVS